MFSFRPHTILLAAAGLLGAGSAHPAIATPVITNLTLTPSSLPVTGGVITVKATITDTQAITNITGYVPGNGSSDGNDSFTLSSGGSGTTFTGTIQVTHYNTSAGPYYFPVTITAKDASGQQTATSAISVVQANDALPPIVTNVIMSPATLPMAGGLVTVMATITDPGKRAITSVTAYINGLSEEIELSNNGVGNIYSGSFQSAVNNINNAPRIYQADVTATNDLNISHTGSGRATVQAYANLPPVITRATVTPSTLPANGGIVRVTAVVTDPNGQPITNVIVNFLGLGYQLSNGGSGNIYTGTYEFGTQVSLVASVIATDSLGLTNSATLNGTQGFAVGTLPELIAPNATSLAISPASVAKGSLNLTLALHGINFQGGSKVLFNGNPLAPNSISATTIIVVVPQSMLKIAGAYEISVVNPAPGGVSNGITFNIY